MEVDAEVASAGRGGKRTGAKEGPGLQILMDFCFGRPSEHTLVEKSTLGDVMTCLQRRLTSQGGEHPVLERRRGWPRQQPVLPGDGGPWLCSGRKGRHLAFAAMNWW